jgi:hypothetical protein
MTFSRRLWLALETGMVLASASHSREARAFNAPTAVWIETPRRDAPKARRKISLKFVWSGVDPGFKKGEAVEFEVHFATRCFLMPPGGRDNVLERAVHNLGPSAYTDVGNYWGKPSQCLSILGSILEQCPSVPPEEAAYVAGYACVTDITDDDANLAVGVRDAASLVRRDFDDPYYFEYPVSAAALPDADCDEPQSSSITGIRVSTFANTCTLPRPSSLIDPVGGSPLFAPTSCPFLIGYGKCIEALLPVIGMHPRNSSWLENLCSPTDQLQFTTDTSPPARKGVSCIDRDGDGYFAVQAEPMLGTRTGDCNDLPGIGVSIQREAYDPATNTCSCPSSPSSNESDCEDSIDGDCDGLLDCDDPDCAEAEDCAREFCPGARDCDGVECGPDPVCKIPCGSCGAGETCVDGSCIRQSSPCPHGDGLYCGDVNDGRDPDVLYECEDGEYRESDDCAGLGCIVNDPGVNDECAAPEDPCASVECPDDRDLCNGPEHCDDGVCTSGPTLSCGSDEVCYPGTGCGCIDGTVEQCPYSGPQASLGVGVCQAGVRQCVDGTWGACGVEVLPQPENCDDGIDNDCDGAVDDDCECLLGATLSCYSGRPETESVGVCQAGVRSCETLEDGARRWSMKCTGEVLPQVEDCYDGIDNDCDELIDCDDGDCADSAGCGSGGQAGAGGASPAECTEGRTETTPCGNCGTQTRSCEARIWSSWSSCGGVGECAVGATRGCGGSATQTCSSECLWGPCNGCGNGSCDADENCGTCATDCPCPNGVCVSDACQDCGTEGQACCTGAACNDGSLVCFAGTCEPCGLLGEPCCFGSPECDTGECVDGFCQPPEPAVVWSTDFEDIDWDQLGQGTLSNGVDVWDAGGPQLRTRMGGGNPGQALTWYGGDVAAVASSATITLPPVLDGERTARLVFDAYAAIPAGIGIVVRRAGCTSTSATIASDAWTTYSMKLDACGVTSRIVADVGEVYQYPSTSFALKFDNISVAYE